MAKQRYINTRFWNDVYIAELDPAQKLLFIYFLTNEHSNIAGVYEVPLKIIAIETGFDESMIKKMLPKLKDRIRYIEGMVVIKNHIKHQHGRDGEISPQVKVGIVNRLKEIPHKFLKNVVHKGYYELPQDYLDTLSIPSIYPLPNSNSNSNLNSIAEAPPVWTFKDFILSLKESKRKDLKVVGRFFEAKKLVFDTSGQAQAAIKRHIRAAKDVAEFTGKQIDWAIDKATEEYPDKWTLETIIKLLTK